MNQKEELNIYRQFFHRMDMYNKTFNTEKIREGVGLMSQYSYAHRCGNGELSSYAQRLEVVKVIEQMKEFSE